MAKKYDKNNIDRCSLQYKEKKWYHKAFEKIVRLELVAFVVMVISFWKFRRIERNRKQ